jgi:hypothetical protein
MKPLLLVPVFVLIFSLFATPSSELRPSRRKPTILFSPTSGLGNNMIGLVSVKRFADRVNLPFAILWDNQTTPSCQAAYKDIFMQEQRQYNFRVESSCERLCVLDLTQNGARECWNMALCGDRADVLSAFSDCDCVQVRSNQYFLPAMKGSEQEHFASAASEMLRPSFEIVARMTTTLASWKEAHNVSHIIGVHVRSAFHSKGVHNSRFIPRENIFKQHYWPCVQKIASNHVDGNVGLFVAADTDTIRDEVNSIVSSSKEMITVLPAPMHRSLNDLGLAPVRDFDEVLDAALELFLLTQCDSLVVRFTSRFDSTFSAVAASLAECGTRTSCVLVDGCQEVKGQVSPDFHHNLGNSSCESVRTDKCEAEASTLPQ